MLYNKAEKRVLQYTTALEKYIWAEQDCRFDVFTEQRKAYTDEVITPWNKIEDYPFGFGAEGQDTAFRFELDVPDL